jgi:saccharopine dehydrogenase-like NADP-dependent oxidoreductase
MGRWGLLAPVVSLSTPVWRLLYGSAFMKKILVIGAGKSSTVLIDYLLAEAGERDWRVRVVDLDLEQAQQRVADHPCGEAGQLDSTMPGRRLEEVDAAAIVISLLPAHMHGPVAEDCVKRGKNFVSASYVSPDVRELHPMAERAGVTLLSEMGVDPGIDHMSAMEVLDELRADGARITAFETFAGGLVAPGCDNNPWRYKLTWNPRNVVLAGQGGVKFKHNGRYKYIPYHKLFKRYEPLKVPGYGDFEGYANRDSLAYRSHYGLWDVDTIYRGTLRRPGYCKAWDCLVQLGLTDDSYELEDLDPDMTYRDFVNAYLWYDKDMSVELKVRAYLKMELNSPEFDKLKWLGLFDKEPIGLSRGTPAQVLQTLLERRWQLAEGDKDMLVMLHKIEYEHEGALWRRQSSMATLGETEERTAMAKTVGLPVGIGAKLVLEGVIERKGVVIPTVADVYAPVLAELRRNGIEFNEQVEPIEAQQPSI